MRIIVLTSSRADYGIYLPLLKKLFSDDFFETEIIAFGTHLSMQHGFTLNQILQDGFEVKHRIKTIPKDDSEYAIAASIGDTVKKFSVFWKKEQKNIDLILCLGDRYEMFAAVLASVPFNLPVAHIHGGETTLGSIDNKFRHSVSLMSKYHFTSTKKYAERVKNITGSNKNIFVVGALSLDNLTNIKLFTKQGFLKKYKINMEIPTVLVTFHPETVSVEKNTFYVNEFLQALKVISDNYQIIITMPNADTMGNTVRKKLIEFVKKNKNTFGIESLGTQGYFSCMKHCCFMLGNSSSGIIEAASFGKYVINIGNRQKGRDSGKNVVHCNISKSEILKTFNKVKKAPALNTKNIYWNSEAASQIIKILKMEFA